MPKHYSSIYFDARRPARARLFPFTLAVGGFVISGFVIGMIYLVATGFLRPASIQAVDRVHVPIYATAPADPEELANRTQFRPSIAKITPPSDSDGAITPSRDTDGRGGGPDGRGRDTAISPKRGKPAEDRLQKIMQICRGC